MEQALRARWRTALGAAAVAASMLFGAAACGSEPTRTTAAGSQSTLTTAPAFEAAGQAEVRRRLRALEAEYEGGRIGAYAIDTATGRTVGYRAQETFPMLSTFKAMACAAVLHKARTADPGLMERVIRYTADDLVDHSPETGKEENLKAGMTVSALCEATITLSDNTAGNLVLRQIGGPAGLTAYLRSLGDPRSRLDRWELELNDWRPGERRDTTTPALMAQNLRKVTTTDALAGPDRARLIAWLRANTTGDARIRAGLPGDWTVGDKTGTGGTYATANDIAIVWPKGATAPLIMAVYTNRGTPDATADNTFVARTATILAQGLGKLP
ncbi:class A beta-lactamase [Thermomonospora cellulosilytica]|uniref:Beta-lactamase n=1 Tax=Thermomonospora cellulosilytica TaxID=1411118 RepID=A0A7W3MYB7_9ACTN|nr:class A beta-lactamase [Thermomonospora cellulosilytica]MBA9004129.1 beta-lactamase class A [Thermomonospora cellulosilytica]